MLVMGQKILDFLGKIITLIQVAAFVWVNGLNPEVFYDWCFLRGIFAPGSDHHRHFIHLFNYFEESRNYNLRAWNISTSRYKFLEQQSN